MNFNGSHGCPKCEAIGKYSHVSRTTIFTDMNAKLRTDESFRSKEDPNHHKGDTPLTDLPIDMVSSFVVGDDLHLLHLGLVRKFLYGWKTGSFGTRTKWSARNIQQISNYLLSCNVHKPSEIHRKIRPLSELPRWKGTELRAFMLYTSLTVLKRFLPDKYYKHYLLFYCSVVILGSEYHCEKMINLADNMIKDFLNIFKGLYGIEHFTSNLHNLRHLTQEVRQFGVLKNFNAYSFENKLQMIKRMVRSGNLPLNQIAKRILESDEITVVAPESLESSSKVKLCQQTEFVCDSFEKVGPKYIVFKELQAQDFKIVNTLQNQWVMTQSYDIVRVKYFVSFADKRCYFYGAAIADKKSFFDIPFDSKNLFIYAAKNVISSSKLYSIEQIACKIFCLPYFGSFNDDENDEENPPFDYVFIPLWHTLK